MAEMHNNLEALLYAFGRPLSRAELVRMLGVEVAEIETAIAALQESCAGRGVVVADDGKEVALRIGGEASALVEKVRKEEYTQSIGKAGLEVLSAVLYRGPVTRAEVDFIRGVNSTQTLRTLTMRGLVRRVPNPRDERSYLYEPTTELLSTLGVAHVRELPEYDKIKSTLVELESAYRTKVTNEEHHE